MALSILGFLVLLVVGQADEILQVPLGVKTPTSVHSINSTDGISSAWSNFVHCKCGFSCAKELGSWYIFSVGQSCSCDACPDANTTAMLRGTNRGALLGTSSLKKQSQDAQPVPEQQTSEKQENPPTVEREMTWDSAHMPGTNLLYCAWSVTIRAILLPNQL